MGMTKFAVGALTGAVLTLLALHALATYAQAQYERAQARGRIDHHDQQSESVIGTEWTGTP